MKSLAIGLSLGIGSALCFAGCNAEGDGPVACLGKTALVSVDASKSLGPVNRMAFGNNMEAADGRGIFGEKVGAAKYDIGGIKFGQGYWNPETKSSNPEIVAATKDIGIGMMRYPGGCLAHNFDWRKAVGPLSERGDWQFGLDQYIKLCRDLNVEPLYTFTDYALPVEELPQHAADLVEYLNAPATPEHPWAMKRKEWGNPEPYGVKWFELGNETDHGNHHCVPGRRYSPEEYVAYAKACAAAMRKVDPSVKIGVVTVPGSGDDYDCKWNMAVYKDACPIADFLVVHYYGPSVDGLDPESCFKACMAYGDQLEWRMKQYSDLCEKLSGKKLPLAVTEYNIGSTQNEPVAYRFSFAAGLLCADMDRLYLKPSNNVANAEYWHVANGYWGMFRCADGKITERKATLPFFQAWGRHFGGSLVETSVSGSPRFEAPGTKSLSPSKGDSMLPSSKLCDVAPDSFDLSKLSGKGINASSQAPGSLTVRFDDYEKESYPEFSKFARPVAVRAREGFCAKISFEARFVPDPASKSKPATLGLGLCDLRGWDKTKSAIAVSGAQASSEWTSFEGRFNTKNDCPGSVIVLRVENLQGPFSGTLEFRNIKIEALSQTTWPAYQGLTSISSLSQDGKTLHVIVFNKSYDEPIEAEIDLKGFEPAPLAKSWTLVQENVVSTKYFEPVEKDLRLDGSSLKRVFPAHSMTAIDFVAK